MSLFPTLPLLSLVLLLFIDSNAFTPPSGFAFHKHDITRRISSRLFMSDGDKSNEVVMSDAPKASLEKSDIKTLSTSSGYTKKNLGYESTSGRLFESGAGSEDCIPDDEYCVIDKESGKLIRLTVAEKERIFLDALQSYYVTGRQLLSDAEFDLLKEDLQWNGSSKVILNRKETMYLAAVQAYLAGEPIMSDADFDKLKTELKEDKSEIAVSSEPKCYIDTGICTVTWKKDYFRSNLLYLPAGAIFTVLWLGFGFILIEPIIRINPLVLLLIGSYPIFYASEFVTNKFIFQDNKVAYGPCPECEAENRVYFGNILFSEGFGDIAKVKCTNCKTSFDLQRNTMRASTLPK